MQCKLVELFSFEYKAELDGGMTEWELTRSIRPQDKEPSINEEEVAEFKYMPLMTSMRFK